MALFIPSVGQCLSVASPVLAVGSIFWLLRHGDRVIARLFPNWEWERKLGWLNIRAHRRAETILRGLRHLLHVLLLVALATVLALSWQVGHARPETGVDLLIVADELVFMGVCLSAWIYYFVAILGPRLQAEFEEEELARYRAENPETDEVLGRRREPTRITVWDSVKPRRF